MKKQGFIPGTIILSIVSYLCIKGMQAVNKRMEEKETKNKNKPE